MTIFRVDKASPEQREAVRRALAPLTDALTVDGLNALAPRILPPGWVFELQPGARGANNERCVWVFLSDGRRKLRSKVWAERGWSLAGLVVAVHAQGERAAPPGSWFALEAVASTLIIGGYAGVAS